MELTIINPSLGIRRTILRYLSLILFASLIIAMVYSRGSSATQTTIFQRYDVPLEGYVLAIFVCLLLLAYNLILALRDDYEVGRVTLGEDGILVNQGKEKQLIQYSELIALEVHIAYGSSVAHVGGQHWKLKVTYGSGELELDVIVPLEELEQLVDWRDKFNNDHDTTPTTAK